LAHKKQKAEAKAADAAVASDGSQSGDGEAAAFYTSSSAEIVAEEELAEATEAADEVVEVAPTEITDAE
jgi:hypothetical protein